MLRRTLAIATGVLALALPTLAHAAPPTALDRITETTSGVVTTDFVPRGTDPDRVVTVIVELSDDPVAVVQAKAGKSAQLKPD